MSRIRFIGILRYLNFDDKPKMHWLRSRPIHSRTRFFPNIRILVSVKILVNLFAEST